MNNVQIATKAIMNMNIDEIERVIAAIKMRRASLSRATKASVSIGDKVEFKGRNGMIAGSVVKINRKNILVRQDNSITTWNVPASMVRVTA